jgi:hypothetical protein
MNSGNLTAGGVLLTAIQLLAAVAAAEAKVFDVKAFGAKGDGAALDTPSIQRAIDACQASAGGKVYFPPGIYRAGTIALKSNVRLYLHEGARLLGSRDLGDYLQRPTGEFCHMTGSAWVLLHGVGVQNVTLEGKGIIDGANAGFTNSITGQWQRGPLGILFERSKNISLLDLTVTRIPAWAVTLFDCDNVNLRRIRVVDVMADGVNPVCSRNVLYDSVSIDGTGDDPITIKNEGPVTGLPLTSDIVISNCVVRNTTHPGFKIGTGTAGVFRNILVRDCTFDISGTAFSIQLMRHTLDTERAIENLCISNVTVLRAQQLFDITTMGVERPVIRNLSFSDITYRSADRGLRPSRIWGTQHAPIRNLTIANLRVVDALPDVWLSLEHVESARLTGFQLDLPQARTALRAVFCRNLHCYHWNFDRFSASGPVVSLEDVSGFASAHTNSLSVSNWLFVFGSGSRDIAPPGDEARASQLPLIADASVSAAGFSSLAEGVRLKDFRVSRTVKPNDPIEVGVTISGAARPGPWLLRVRDGAKELGVHWEWAFADRARAVCFAIPALYKGGRHNLTLDSLSAQVEVTPTAAAFEYGELAEIVSPAAGALTRVKATVKNVGGTAGDHTVELRADGRTLSAQTLRLEPGEAREVALEHRFENPGARILTLGDFPPWPFFTTANVAGRFYWGHRRLVIEAGGEPRRRGTYATIYRAGVKGDFDAIARLHHQSMTTGENSEIGLVIRNDLADGKAAGFTMHFREPKYGAYKVWFLDLDGDGVLETRSDGGSTTLPGWYKFEKRGQQFRAYTSGDREHWSPCGKWFTITSAGEVQDVGIYGNAASALGEMSRVEFSDFEVLPVPARTSTSAGATK